MRVCAEKLSADRTLAARSRELGELREQATAVRAEVEAGERELHELKARTDAEREDLELIKNKQRLLAELTAANAEAERRALTIKGAAEEAVARATAAKEERDSMVTEMCKVSGPEPQTPSPTPQTPNPEPEGLDVHPVQGEAPAQGGA